MMQGRIVLCPTPLGNLEDITLRTLRVLRECDIVFAEDTRVTQKLLRHYQIRKPLRSFHESMEPRRLLELPILLAGGKSIAVVTDAGMPGISDPGLEIVRAARRIGCGLEVLPGPSALLGALVLSGFEVSRFRFEGFPPRKAGARRNFLERLAGEAAAVAWYEAPSRMGTLLRDIQAVLGARRLFVLREYTKRFEQQCCGTAAEIIEELPKPALGEFVVVLEGAPQTAAAQAPALGRASEALAMLMRSGVRLRLAVDAMRTATGLPRNQLYDMAQQLDRD